MLFKEILPLICIVDFVVISYRDEWLYYDFDRDFNLLNQYGEYEIIKISVSYYGDGLYFELNR